jgi:dipeptidyl aminopeptidase/acylaminoacyl peptidase
MRPVFNPSGLVRRPAALAALAVVLVGTIVLVGRRESSDGCRDQAVVAASRELPSDDVVGMPEVVVVSNTGSVTSLTPDWVAVQPSFNSTGDELVVVRAEGDYESAGPSHTELWAVSVDGHDARQLTSGPLDDDPDWAPTHDRIAFTRWNGASTSLVAASGEGDEPRVLYRPPPGTWLATPVWSPDGEWIAFMRGEPLNDTDRITLVVVDADGNRLRTVAEMPSAASVDWHPDGKSLLVVSEATAYLVDLRSGGTTRVGTQIQRARWAATGKQVIFTTSPDAVLVPSWARHRRFGSCRADRSAGRRGPGRPRVCGSHHIQALHESELEPHRF